MILKINFFKTSKKQEKVFTDYRNMHIYCKNCKKHTECTIPKILVLILDKKAKSKYAKFLTDRTFFGKINDEYDL